MLAQLTNSKSSVRKALKAAVEAAAAKFLQSNVGKKLLQPKEKNAEVLSASQLAKIKTLAAKAAEAEVGELPERVARLEGRADAQASISRSSLSGQPDYGQPPGHSAHATPTYSLAEIESIMKLAK